jgi:hypothetical protein
MVLFMLLTVAVLVVQTQFVQPLEVGDTVCVEGQVMDYFCIERGFLFDNPDIRTLEGPEEHSVHCLIDVDECNGSPYEILLDPLPGESQYARGWRLDDETKSAVVDLARSVGKCQTCNDDTIDEPIERALRVAIVTTVSDLGSSSTPPTVGGTNPVISIFDRNICSTLLSALETPETPVPSQALTTPTPSASPGVSLENPTPSDTGTTSLETPETPVPSQALPTPTPSASSVVSLENPTPSDTGSTSLVENDTPPSFTTMSSNQSVAPSSTALVSATSGSGDTESAVMEEMGDASMTDVVKWTATYRFLVI